MTVARGPEVGALLATIAQQVVLAGAATAALLTNAAVDPIEQP